MNVSFNMSLEVFTYFKDYNMSELADTLLDMYDFTNLPATSGIRDKEIRVNVTNKAYIELYNTLGPRSKKVSLGRLFEFAYNMNVLSLERFEILKRQNTDNPLKTLLNRAYKALLEAQKFDKSDELKKITNLVYEYNILYVQRRNNENN